MLSTAAKLEVTTKFLTVPALWAALITFSVPWTAGLTYSSRLHKKAAQGVHAQRHVFYAI